MTGPACPNCQNLAASADRYCENCGAQLFASASLPDMNGTYRPAASARSEDTALTAAAVSDRGLVRLRNEDAFALAAVDGRCAVVVCDGVASTPCADRAANAAASAALEVLRGALRATDEVGSGAAAGFLRMAVERAQSAAAQVRADPSNGGGISPSTTLVAALTYPGRMGIAHVGDSRAYWVPDEVGAGQLNGGATATLLTEDDTVGREAIAGGASESEAMRLPRARTITGWLGADADSFDPHLLSVTVDSPGTLVLCTDGLWQYYDDPDDMAALVRSARLTDASCLGLARELTDAAVRKGGADNVTVAVVTVQPARLVLASGMEE